MLIEIHSKEQFDKEIASGKAVVDFNATWCGPCQMLKPIVEKIAQENPDLKFLSVDTDEVPSAAEQFAVYSIPNVVVLEDGKEVNRSVGYIPEPAFKKFLGL